MVKLRRGRKSQRERERDREKGRGGEKLRGIEGREEREKSGRGECSKEVDEGSKKHCPRSKILLVL